jgi:DNA polymerase
MKLKECNKCALHKTRMQVVIHRGKKSDIMMIGEAPGHNEDIQGKPFVGKAGKVLDDALLKADLYNKVYITNIVKCRPPENRDPLPSEKEKCSYWLNKQIAIIVPKVIVCLGNHAFNGMQILSSGRIRMVNDSKFDGVYVWWEHIDSIPICVYKVLHPAATLYNPNLRKTFFKQINNIRKLL